MRTLVVMMVMVAILGLTVVGVGQQTLFVQDDPVEDDYGPGSYKYPTSTPFNKGAFDITRVEIGVTKSDLVIKVQIAGKLLNPWGAPNGFSVQMIDFYLDTAPGGSTETIFDTTIPGNLAKNPYGTINAIIANDAAWEYAFRIQGWVGDLFIPMTMEPMVTEKLGRKPYGVNVAFHLPPAREDTPKYAKYENVADIKADPRIRTITITIPLHLFFIGQTSPDWKFIIYMAGVDWGNARVVLARKGDWVFGGGENDDSDPNIIDMLGPQEEILNYKKRSPVVLPGLSIAAPLLPKEPSARVRYLSPEEYVVLDEMFRVHMNYFLSPEVIAHFGFPMSAYKVGVRGRFGYSNPTEWGYAWQAWIAAAERGIISKDEAACRLLRALSTLEMLQLDPEESYHGFPYPFYKMTTPDGRDLCAPYHDPSNLEIPSGDNALLYASLVIVEGWARKNGDVAPWNQLWKQAERIRKRMNFRMFLTKDGPCLYLAHTLNAENGRLSPANWEIYADEGGVVVWIAYLSGAISFEEYVTLTKCQYRRSASWKACDSQVHTVAEAAWFNAMFTWSVRSLAGFPISSFDVPAGSKSLYSQESLVPAVQAHLAYGDCVGVDYPAFSDAMSQAEKGRGLVGWIQGWYIPPNLPGLVGRVPHHALPHALFVPFNALPDLPAETRVRLISEILELKMDRAGYYHDSGPYSFGFEVIVSPRKDDLEYRGADDGRPVFETLSQAYIVLSLFNALQLAEGKPTFSMIAMLVPGYEEKVRQVLGYLYPE